ncbi:dienelactone hydrolase family protein [Nitrospira sp. Nam80]
MAEELNGEMVQYSSENTTVKAYLVAPPGKEKRPAVIVIQEWWGLTDLIKDVAQRFAREGYVAIAPDLYSRLGNRVATDSSEAAQLMNKLRQEDGLKDLNATVTYLKTLPGVEAGKIGVTGFCMGGSYALMLPCINPSIKAAAPFYGWVPNPDTPIQNLACPVLYFYGEEDGFVPKADVQRLAAALKKYNKPGEIKTYSGAGHAFFRDTDPSVYKPAEARDAWNRTLAFFRQHMT